MQFLSGSNIKPVISSLQNHLAVPLVSQLTPHQSRIALIAAAIFSTLAALFFYFFTCFRRQDNDTTISATQQSSQSSPSISRVDQAVRETPPLAVQYAKPQEASKLVEPPSVNSLPASVKQSQPKAVDDEDMGGETDDDFGLVDEDYIDASADSEEMDEDSLEETPKKAAQPAQKYYLNGKECSLRTLKCHEKLTQELNVVGKELGKAVDNGDCLLDSFGQGLSKHLGREVTIKELRLQLSAFIQKLDQGPDSANWFKQAKQKEYAASDTYEDVRDRIAFDCAESLEKGFIPIWPQEWLEGVILCRLYQVNLRVYTAGCIDEDSEKMGYEDNYYSGEQDYPAHEHYPHTIEMALWPPHFMPVWKKGE